MEQLKHRLESRPGIERVQVRPTTGSILVEGRRDEQIDAALHEVFDLVRVFAEGEPSERAVELVVEAIRSADGRVKDVTGGWLSLRWLVPATFVGVGVRQLLAQGLTLGNVPWYVLIYYGVDSFLKLYPEHAPHDDSDPDGQSS
jgi:hypothetical protein